MLLQHKNWVCRRLALPEKLSVGAREELQLGLLTPSLARPLLLARLSELAAGLLLGLCEPQHLSLLSVPCQGNTLALWTTVYQISPQQAAVDFCQRLCLDAPAPPPAQLQVRDSTNQYSRTPW